MTLGRKMNSDSNVLVLCVYVTLGPDYEVSTRRREAARPPRRRNGRLPPAARARPWP